MVRADGTHIIVQVGADFQVTNVLEGGQGQHGKGGSQPPAGGDSGRRGALDVRVDVVELTAPDSGRPAPVRFPLRTRAVAGQATRPWTPRWVDGA
jgi:hypothetical protein